MPVVSELLTRRPEATEGVSKTKLRINRETRELFISDGIGERHIVLKGLLGWATLSSLIGHSDTLEGATNKDVESDVEAEGVAFLQRAGDYIFNLRRVIERDPQEPKIIIRTGTTKKPRYQLAGEISSTEETRLIPKIQKKRPQLGVAGVVFTTDKRPPGKPKQPRSLYPIVLGKPREENLVHPVQVQKKPNEEAKRKVMVDDRVVRVLGEILLFKANWQYLVQALAGHGIKIDERQYRELQSSHKIFTKTMKSNGADNQALNFLTERIIPDFASADGQRKTIINAQKSDYVRFLLSVLEPLPKEELLKVFKEMRFQFVTKA